MAVNIEQLEDVKYVLIGFLNKPYGLKGMEQAGVGHPVYEYNGRYHIFIESPNKYIDYDGSHKNLKVRVGFYKETLNPVIDFIEEKQLTIQPITHGSEK